MIKKYLSVLVAGLTIAAVAQSSRAAELKITVNNIQTGKGEIRIALYKQADQWLSKSFKKMQEPAVEGSVTVVFKDLPPGDYAVALYHDVDGDGKMAKNFMGIPKEPTGFSNDARGSFGPPSFDAVKVTLPEESKAIAIRLD